MGWDPLLFTRILSAIALLSCAALCRAWLSGVALRPAWLKAGAWPLVLGNGCLVYAALYGMETAIFSLLLTLDAYLWWWWRGRKSAIAILPFVLVSILTLVCRPDACVWLLALLISDLSVSFLRIERKGRARDIYQLAVVFSILCITGFLFFWWKYAYFGNHLPNPFYVKHTAAVLSVAGIRYVSLFLIWSALLVLSMLWSLWAIRETWNIALVIACCAFIISYVQFEPLMGTAFRFLVPVWPVMAFCGLRGLGEALERVKRKCPRPKTRYRLALAVLSFVWFIAWSAAAYAHIDRTLANHNTRNYAAIGRALKASGIDPVPTIAAHDQGALPYYSTWRTLDFVGLVTNEVARQDRGEEIAEFILRQRPEVVVLRRRTVAGEEATLFIPHARTTNLAQCIERHSLFKGQYEGIGSIPDERGHRIVFYLDTRARAAPRIVAAFQSGLSEVEGSIFGVLAKNGTAGSTVGPH